MSYKRQVRVKPNKVYSEVNKDEVKMLFDLLNNNSIESIRKETGFSKHFVSETINQYLKAS